MAKIEVTISNTVELPRKGSHLIYRILLIIPCLYLIGCGDSGPPKDDQYPVSGKVTVKGQPLTDCTISFVSTDPSKVAGFSGVLDSSGSYTLTDQADGKSGAFAGTYKIVLAQSPEAAKKAMMEGGTKGYESGGLPFPKEFQSADTSPKEVEVKAESNTINIDIE